MSLTVTISHCSQAFAVLNEHVFNIDMYLSAKYTIHIRIFSSCCTFSGLGQMCNIHVYHCLLSWKWHALYLFLYFLQVHVTLDAFVLHMFTFLQWQLALDPERPSLLMAQQKAQVYQQTQSLICMEKQLWLEEVQFLICIKILCLDWCSYLMMCLDHFKFSSVCISRKSFPFGSMWESPLWFNPCYCNIKLN